jgi:hypothetical protein
VYMRRAAESSFPLPKFGRPLPITVRLFSAGAGNHGGAVRTLTASALNQLSSGSFGKLPPGHSPAALPIAVAPPSSPAVTFAPIDSLHSGMPRGTFAVDATVVDAEKKPNGTLEATLYQADPHIAAPHGNTISRNRITVVCQETQVIRVVENSLRRGRRVQLLLVSVVPKTAADIQYQSNVHPLKLIIDRHSHVTDLGAQNVDLMPPVVTHEIPGQNVAASNGIIGFMRRPLDANPTPAPSQRPVHGVYAVPVPVPASITGLSAQQLRQVSGAPSRAGSTTITGAPSVTSGPVRTLFNGGSSSSRSTATGSGATVASNPATASKPTPPGEAQPEVTVTRGDVVRRDAILQRRAIPAAPARPKSHQCIFCRYDMDNSDSVAALLKRIETQPHHTPSGKSSVQHTRDTVIAALRDPRSGAGGGRLECKALLRDPLTNRPYVCHPRCAHVATWYQKDGDLADVCSARARCHNCAQVDGLVECYEPTCKKTYCIPCALFSESLVNFGRHDPVNPCAACPSHTMVEMSGALKAKRTRTEARPGRSMFDSSECTGWVRDPDDDDDESDASGES